MSQLLRGFSFLFLCSVLIIACKKESFSTDSSMQLRTSVDTLHFDTVFTSTGSFSQVIKVLNPNSSGIRINSVKLAGGAASPFRINVDGNAGPVVNDVAVAGEDSIYIFVTVSINPTAANLPFVVQDSIEILYNGNRKMVQLDALGQNANFMRDKVITTNESWNAGKPYVILGSLTVAPNTTLTINEGCKVYFHADAPFLIQGTLEVNGGPYDSTRVLFTGDRLDEPYRSFPGAFPGLFFMESSRNNRISYGVIRNAYQAVVVTDPAPGTKLILNETIIENAYDAGIFGINTSISGRNLLVSNCGKNILLVKGGTYDFAHCTLSSLSTNYLAHKQPVLFVSNYISQNNVITSNPLTAAFRNCIIWGENNGFVDTEVVAARQGTNPYSVVFDNVLWRVPADPANVVVTGTHLKNIDPLFDSLDLNSQFFSYRLRTGSPAIDKGGSSSVNLDLDGKPRPVGLPDLGAYEKQ